MNDTPEPSLFEPGTPPSPVHPFTESPNIVTAYFQKLRAILFSPTEFFRNLPLRQGVVTPLVFAVVTHWIGAGLEFLWKSAMGQILTERVHDFMSVVDRFGNDVDSSDRMATFHQLREQAFHWFWGIGSVISDPFITVLSILNASAMIWIGARLLVPPRAPDVEQRLSFETALTIVCYGMAPTIFHGLPLVGMFVSWVLCFMVTVTGAKEMYRISGTRSAVIVLFPSLLFMLLIMGIFAVVAFGIFKLVMGLVA